MNVQYYRPSNDRNDNKEQQIVQITEDSNSNTNDLDRIIEKTKDTGTEQISKSNLMNQIQVTIFQFLNRIYLSCVYFIKKIWFLCFALSCFYVGAYSSKNQVEFSRFSSQIPTINGVSFQKKVNHMFPKIGNNWILNNRSQISNNKNQTNESIDEHKIIDLDKYSYPIMSTESNSKFLSLQDKQNIWNDLNGLIQEYKQSIKPSGRWVLDLNTFVGYQIVDNRTVQDRTTTSLPSRFDQLLDQSLNEPNIHTRSNVYSVIYGLQLLTKNLTKLKQNIIVKLIVIFGFSLSYRLK